MTPRDYAEFIVGSVLLALILFLLPWVAVVVEALIGWV